MQARTKTAASSARAANKDLGLQSEVLHLEAWAQEELASQRALGEALVAQENAIREGSTPGLLETSEAVRVAAQRHSLRERRRLASLRPLARRFGVAVETLTLASVAARAEEAGLDASRLVRARGDLREAIAEALKRGRRIASLARHHRAVVDALFRDLAGRSATEVDANPKARQSGLVVDREA